MTTPLTPVQHAILAKAIHTIDGKITWFPDHIKGSARQKVLVGMGNRDLITTNGTDWFVAAGGYDALGMSRPAVGKSAIDPFEEHLEQIRANAHAAPAATNDHELEAAVTAAESTWTPAPEPEQPKPRTRDNSKQAEVMRMLQRPEGATIGQICQATGWQPHTVRGTFAGTFKKRLGLQITSVKASGADRIYRVASAGATP